MDTEGLGMSTKIFNGLKLTVTNLFELDRLVKELRAEVMAAVAIKRAQYVARCATNIHDRRLLGIAEEDEPEAARSPYIRAVSRLRKCDETCYGGDQSRSSKFAYPDHTFELCLFPYKRAVYAIPYTEDRDLLGLLTSKSWVSEYGYWDNTDQPDSIDDREWRRRRKVWDGVFAGCYMSVSANGGFQVNLSPRQWEFLTWPEIQKQIPTLEKRRSEMKLAIVHREWSREMHAKSEAEGRKPETHEFVFGFGEARKKDPRWNIRLAEEDERLKTVLPETLTPEMLGFPQHRLETL
jgi:hypothetical protein